MRDQIQSQDQNDDDDSGRVRLIDVDAFRRQQVHMNRERASRERELFGIAATDPAV